MAFPEAAHEVPMAWLTGLKPLQHLELSVVFLMRKFLRDGN